MCLLLVCEIASCFFCVHKGKSGKQNEMKGNWDFYGETCPKFLLKLKNIVLLCGRGTIQILIHKLNDWTVYSNLTMGPRCWIPHARCCTDSSWLQRFPDSPSHSSSPSPHLLLLKRSLNITPAPCYGCGTALCVPLGYDSRKDLI